MKDRRRLTDKAFEQAGRAFEALVRNGDNAAADRGFHRLIAAAAYHLAGYSAVAFSLFNEVPEDLNLSPGEVAAMLLILRDLNRLRAYVRDWLTSADNSDAMVAARLGDSEDSDIDEAIAVILNTTICRALAFFDFALQSGEEGPIEDARRLLAIGVRLAENSANVPLWWITSICRQLIDDL